MEVYLITHMLLKSSQVALSANLLVSFELSVLLHLLNPLGHRFHHCYAAKDSDGSLIQSELLANLALGVVGDCAVKVSLSLVHYASIKE